MKREDTLTEVGKKYGLLTIKSIYFDKGCAFAKCECECGGRKDARLGHLKEGVVRSCGCLKKRKRPELAGKNRYLNRKNTLRAGTITEYKGKNKLVTYRARISIYGFDVSHCFQTCDEAKMWLLHITRITHGHNAKYCHLYLLSELEAYTPNLDYRTKKRLEVLRELYPNEVWKDDGKRAKRLTLDDMKVKEDELATDLRCNPISTYPLKHHKPIFNDKVDEGGFDGVEFSEEMFPSRIKRDDKGEILYYY